MEAVEINLFGELRVSEDGVPVRLPPSKKARALFAYLIVTGRPQRREHLCELFWDAPHDPKGALRWVLSKLRSALSEQNQHRIQADRERVFFDTSGLDLQIPKIQALIDSDRSTKDELLTAKGVLDEVFLVGIELSRMDGFAVWLAEQRETIQRLKSNLLQRYLRCADLHIDERVQSARDWVQCRPYDPQAAKTLVTALRQQGKTVEAARLEAEFGGQFTDLDAPDPGRARRGRDKNDAIGRNRTLLSAQKIRFCKTQNGVNLAYASVGSGPPLVKAANWLTHLELDWSAPIWSPLYRELATNFTFIRYDERGNGLSDWDVDELSQEIFVQDLECVVDSLDLEKFPLLGISQGAAVSIEYAIRHPERVSKLILFGGYPKGWRVDSTPEVKLQSEAMITLTKTGWGQNNPAYRHVFSSTFMPSASAADLAWFDEFQRLTTSPDNAVKFLQAFADIDVRHQLSKISVPTLVIHSRGDQRINWQVGRDIAAEIPDAELVTLDSDNHLLLEGEPAAEQFLSAVRSFLLD